MKCPICASEFVKKNNGHGRFYECKSGDSVLYSMALLKRQGYDEAKLKSLFRKAKAKISSSDSVCSSCGHNYHVVEYVEFDYKTKIYICTSCMEFVFLKRDLHLFQGKKVKDEDKKQTTKIDEISKKLDLDLLNREMKWKKYDKAIKVSKSKTLGAVFFGLMFVLAFVRISLTYMATTWVSTVFSVLLFLVVLTFVFLFFSGKTSLKDIFGKYFTGKD